MFAIKDLIFYSIAGGVIGAITTLLGASLSVTLFLSLLIPPVLLLAYRIIKSP